MEAKGTLTKLMTVASVLILYMSYQGWEGGHHGEWLAGTSRDSVII